mmetsp:Transcript_73284/g.136961  ORF Transcript_73284/g.136961 Transcript_73284/m.136961 type:complete len:215 (+) Transcript_73284:69-713(+)
MMTTDRGIVRCDGTCAPKKDRSLSLSPRLCHKKEDRSYAALLRQQQIELPDIIKELELYRKKVGHWIWYVFPTEKEGFSDPCCTKVSEHTAADLCTNPKTSAMWRQALEKVCDLLEDEEGHGMNVLFEVDYGRVDYFIKFWKDRTDTPTWMAEVCARLDKFKWTTPWQPWGVREEEVACSSPTSPRSPSAEQPGRHGPNSRWQDDWTGKTVRYF